MQQSDGSLVDGAGCGRCCGSEEEVVLLLSEVCGLQLQSLWEIHIAAVS